MAGALRSWRTESALDAEAAWESTELSDSLEQDPDEVLPRGPTLSDDEDRDLHELLEHVVHVKATAKSVVLRETCRACHLHRARFEAPPVALPKCVLLALLHYLCRCGGDDHHHHREQQQQLLRRQADKPYTPECLSDTEDSSDEEAEHELARVSLEAHRHMQEDEEWRREVRGDRDGDPLGTDDEFRSNMDRLFDLTDLEEEQDEGHCVSNVRVAASRVYADARSRRLNLAVNGVWSRTRLTVEVYRGAYEHRVSLVYRAADKTLRLCDPSGAVVLLGPLWTSGLETLRRLADLALERDSDEHEIVFSHGRLSLEREPRHDPQQPPDYETPCLADERLRWRDTALLLALLREDDQARRLLALYHQQREREQQQQELGEPGAPEP